MKKFNVNLIALTLFMLLSSCVISNKVQGVLYSVPGNSITAPSTALVGEPFLITVLTSSYPCKRLGNTEITVNGLVAEVNVYDFQTQNTACLDITLPLPHEAEITFNEIGNATVRIITGIDGSNDPSMLNITELNIVVY